MPESSAFFATNYTNYHELEFVAIRGKKTHPDPIFSDMVYAKIFYKLPD